MKLGRLNHIGIATPSLEASIAYYRDVMGAVKSVDMPVRHLEGRIFMRPAPSSGAWARRCLGKRASARTAR